jgi:hypothetical protein
MVSPRALRMARELKAERGIERVMIKVLRQDPRKSRIMTAFSPAATSPSITTPFTAARTKIDWSANSLVSISGGRPLKIRGMASFTASTTVRV